MAKLRTNRSAASRTPLTSRLGASLVTPNSAKQGPRGRNLRVKTDSGRPRPRSRSLASLKKSGRRFRPRLDQTFIPGPFTPACRLRYAAKRGNRRYPGRAGSTDRRGGGFARADEVIE